MPRGGKRPVPRRWREKIQGERTVKLFVKFVPVLVGMFLAVALGAGADWAPSISGDKGSVSVVAGTLNEIGWP
ncbi:hypothetical protein KPP03845_103338 [Streptomyces xanthophaeus]|nr:hypothetical protein KPP03845_103338 [Streptomyces xanthophaeus]